VGQLGGEAVEVAPGQLVECLARPQADHGHAGREVTGPVGAPSEPAGNLDETVHVTGVTVGPGGVEVAGGLGHQQVEIRT
jgi:hypothetical protein